MANFIFASAVPADLQSTDNSQALKALTTAGMTGVSISADVPEDFGKKLVVAGTPSLPVGMAFMLLRPTRIEGKDRLGNDLSYDAFIVVLENGEERAVAVTALLTPWLPKSKDMSEKQQAMFEGFEKSIKTIDAFHKSYDDANTINSPESGFNIQLSIEDRIARFSKGVITTDASEQFDFKFTNKKTQKEDVGRQRLSAFSAEDKTARITAFTKAVKAARKA